MYIQKYISTYDYTYTYVWIHTYTNTIVPASKEQGYSTTLCLDIGRLFSLSLINSTVTNANNMFAFIRRDILIN